MLICFRVKKAPHWRSSLVGHSVVLRLHGIIADRVRLLLNLVLSVSKALIQSVYILTALPGSSLQQLRLHTRAGCHAPCKTTKARFSLLFGIYIQTVRLEFIITMLKAEVRGPVSLEISNQC